MEIQNKAFLLLENRAYVYQPFEEIDRPLLVQLIPQEGKSKVATIYRAMLRKRQIFKRWLVMTAFRDFEFFKHEP